MQRINVVGTSASGKSTFSRQLAAHLNLAYIELDNLFWLDDWQQSPDAVFFAKIQQAIDSATHGYVIDGNYTRSIPIKWAEVDTIIWLDLPFYVNFYRSVKRAIQRSLTQKRLWTNSNNTESLKQLFSQDSIVWWMIKTHRKNQKHYLQLMQSPEYQHIRWIRLQSVREMNTFLAKV